MARYLVRRLLLMVPTFLGIALVTFGIASALGDPLAGGQHDPEVLPHRRLDETEAARLREALGFDRPALLNLDVEDRRRFVERDVEWILDHWGDPGSALGIATRLDRLREHGAMAVVHAHGPLRRHGADRAALTAVLRVLSDGIREAIADVDGLPALAARTGEGGPWSGSEVEGAVARWVDALVRGDIDAAQRFERVLHPLGGIAVPHVVAKTLEAPPALKEPLGAWLRSHSSFDGWHWGLPEPGAPADPVTLEMLDIADSRLRHWWLRNRLRYSEIGGFERWGHRSWSETRFVRWLSGILRGDFGESIGGGGRPVRDVLAQHLPPTLLIQGAALAVMLLVAVPLGVWSAVRRGSWIERAVAAFLFLLYAAPEFWLGTLAILHLHGVFPTYGLRAPEIDAALRDGTLSAWSPAAVADLARHLVLPVGVLALGGIAVLARYARTGLLEVLSQDFVRTARAKGLPERTVVWKHGFRIGAVPLATLAGALLPMLVGGSIIVEEIFHIPGMGSLALHAARNSDVPVAMAVMTLTAVLTMIGFVVADLLAAWLDPRIRLR